VTNLSYERYPKNSDIYCNTHCQTLAKNSFCSEDKQEGKTGGEISRAREKATLLGFVIYQISPSTLAFPLQKV